MRNLAWHRNAEREKERERERLEVIPQPRAAQLVGSRWGNGGPQKISPVNKADGNCEKPSAALPKRWHPSMGLGVIHLGEHGAMNLLNGIHRRPVQLPRSRGWQNLYHWKARWRKLWRWSHGPVAANRARIRCLGWQLLGQWNPHGWHSRALESCICSCSVCGRRFLPFNVHVPLSSICSWPRGSLVLLLLPTCRQPAGPD